MDDFPASAEFPDGAGTFTKIGLAADWLSQRMQGGPQLAARGRWKTLPEIPEPVHNPAEYDRCANTCYRDITQREAYCNSLPNQLWRHLCWIHHQGPAEECVSYCRWQFLK